MVDVEKQLGSLFEKLDQERKTKAEEYQKTEQRMKNLKISTIKQYAILYS
jgi:hypothetical protein